MINTNAIHSSNLLRNYDADSFCTRDSSQGSGIESRHLPARLIDTYKKYKEAKDRQSARRALLSTAGCRYQLGDTGILIREYQETMESHIQIGVLGVGGWDEESWAAKGYKRVSTLCNTQPKFETLFSVLPTEILVDNFQHAIENSWGDKLQSRLKDLYVASIDEFPEQAPIAPESLRGFIKFISYFPSLRYPGTVLTPDGSVRVRWKNSDREQLSVTFINHNDLSYVVFAPNPKHRGKTLRNSGVATVDMFEQIMAPYNVTSLYLSQDQASAA